MSGDGGGAGAAGDGEELDFFEMLGITTRNRMEEQRSQHIPEAEKPMVINFDLLKNQIAGKTIVVDTAITFPCYYMGHEPCHYSHDKEKLCNDLVARHCATSKHAKLSKIKDAFKSHVKCDEDGIRFVLGSAGAATVKIDLNQVACVSLCPKKPGGELKIVAILCRSARARQNKKGVGELGMVLHMCRLKNQDAMWNFQRAFVEALKKKFPEFHKAQDEKKARESGDGSESAGASPDAGGGGGDAGASPSSPTPAVMQRERTTSVEMSPSEEIKPAMKMPRAHKVFVKTKEELAQRDVDMARRMQLEEEAALRSQAEAENADAALAIQLQEAEDAAMARRESLSFDDVDPANSLPM